MAIAASTAWEVRPAGSGASDNNGGGYCGNSGLAIPTTPTVTASAGGSIAVNTYYCVVSYRDANGIEGPKSAQQTVTTTSTNKTITVTSPAASTGAISYSVYFGTISGGPYFQQSTGNVIGVDKVITATPPTTGTQPFGTDYSQQDGPQVVINNTTITTSITANVITFTGYAPSSADVGNIAHMLTGTNITAGAYQITAITATTWTVTGPATLPTTGTTTNATGNMGGALSSPGGAGLLHVAKNTIYVKAATYSITSASTNVSGGCVFLTGSTGLLSAIVGYQTTRGDLGTRPLLQASGISTFTIVGGNSTFRVENISIDGASLTSSRGLGGNIVFVAKRVKIANCTNSGVNAGGTAICMDCEVTGCSTAGGAFNSGCRWIDCIAHDNTVPGFILANGSDAVTNCSSINNTGSTTDGFQCATNNAGIFTNCTAYGNGRHGIFFAAGTSGYGYAINCLAVNNGAAGAGFGFSAVGIATNFLINCAGYNNHDGTVDPANILGAKGTPGAYEGFITLGADPFNNAAGNDFSLNNTVNGGALLKGVGFPSTLAGLSTTTKPDIGSSQGTSVPGAVLSRSRLGM